MRFTPTAALPDAGACRRAHLSRTARAQARHSHRLLAIVRDLADIGIGGYPARTALLLAANNVASWTLAALVMAWSMRAPAKPAAAP